MIIGIAGRDLSLPAHVLFLCFLSLYTKTIKNVPETPILGKL